jgi:hypothetical protein
MKKNTIISLKRTMVECYNIAKHFSGQVTIEAIPDLSNDERQFKTFFTLFTITILHVQTS